MRGEGADDDDGDEERKKPASANRRRHAGVTPPCRKGDELGGLTTFLYAPWGNNLFHLGKAVAQEELSPDGGRLRLAFETPEIKVDLVEPSVPQAAEAFIEK